MRHTTLPIYLIVHIALLLFLAISPVSYAQAISPQDKTVSDTLRLNLQELLGEEVVSVSPSAMAGMYNVQLAEGTNILASKDGKHFITGDLFEIKDRVAINHSERRRSIWRKEKLAAVSKRDLLVFSPQTEAKTYVNVFTDVDCGYCRRLHQEVPAINKYGIEVRYLAFPRSGVGSPTYKKMVTAWCSVDGRRALTQLKNGKEIPTKLCVDNPVSKQYELGKLLGVRGTPAIFTASGELLPGYMPPEELAKHVGVR